MRKSHSAGVNLASESNRPKSMTTKVRRLLLAVILCIILAGTGTIGYRLGMDTPASAAPLDDISSVTAFVDQLARQDEFCAAVEQINLEEQLEAERIKNQEMANSFEKQQQEIDNLEETILNALMSNLSDNLISRSGGGLDSICKEAKNLVSLNRKLKKFLKTEEAEKVDLTEYKNALNKKLRNLPTLKPIPGVLDGYGWRIHPVYHRRDWHPACDIGAPYGTKIKAAGGGRVVGAGYDGSAGRFVKIDHGNGFVTKYYHCAKLHVSAGDTVSKGEVIATVGSSGVATCPHLHFECEYYGSSFNPRKIILE